MAYGYAATSGTVGVCCGTVGPGATNLITGVASAYMDSVPVIALTAQVGTSAIGKGALQEGAGVGRTVDQVALFEKITKLSTMELRGKNLPDTIRRALRVALSGRPGPVHIDLPADVQGEEITAEILLPSEYRPTKSQGVNGSEIKTVAELLRKAEKPAILVGYGAASASEGRSALVNLAERLASPVATTLRAKGVFPEDHPLSLGCVGLYGTHAANSYLRSDVDVLLCLGASFHEFTSHCWDPAFIPSKALIQVDIDPTEIGKNYPMTVALVSDVGAFAEALSAELGSDTGKNADIVGGLKESHDYFNEKAMFSDSMPMKPQRLMRELRDALPRDVIVFADIGNTLTWAERCFQAYPEGRFVTLSGLAAMGSATAACIGGKLGRPRSPVVCLCGDGDFMMTGMEVATAASHGIPVIWVILKNSRLAMVHDIQGVSYQGRYIAASFSDVDFPALAHALGANGCTVEKPSDVGPVVREALQKKSPTVIEAIIDNTEVPPMKPRMLALRRSLGIPDVKDSISWNALKALWQMVKER
jgi:acetolactate synthase I/II/III large subunit